MPCKPCRPSLLPLLPRARRPPLQGLERAVSGSPDGLDAESVEHVGNLVLRALECSAGAGWLVSFGGIAIGEH